MDLKPELIAQILTLLISVDEEYLSLNDWVNSSSLRGHTKAEIHHHINLCCDAGFLTEFPPETPSTTDHHYRLTWEGHRAMKDPRSSIYREE